MSKRLVLIAALVACGGKSSEQAPASDYCDLTGVYRLRFGAAAQWMWAGTSS